MTFYQVSYGHAQDGNLNDWFATKQEATQRQRELVKEGLQANTQIDYVLGVIKHEIKNKKDWIEWLNNYVVLDNG